MPRFVMLRKFLSLRMAEKKKKETRKLVEKETKDSFVTLPCEKRENELKNVLIRAKWN